MRGSVLTSRVRKSFTDRTPREREPKENSLFLAVVLTYLAVLAVFSALEAAGVTVRLPLVLGLISGELTLVIPMVLYILIRRPSLRGLSVQWRLPIAVIPLLILMAYCMMPLISVINLVSMMLAGENAAASMLGTLQQLPLWVSLLCVAVLPGVVEEFIFRGLLYSEHRRRRTWGAILASGVLFGLMHMNLNQFCYAFVIGVLFCLVYEATGSLLAPMLMHMVYNGNSVILTYLMNNGTLSDGSANAAADSSAQMLQQMLGNDAMRWELLIVAAMMLILGLIGLAVAGGLYVAVVKLCRREQQVLLLFQHDSWKKRIALGSRETIVEEDMETGNGQNGSRKICGPVFWIGTSLSALVIVLGVIAA